MQKPIFRQIVVLIGSQNIDGSRGYIGHIRQTPVSTFPILT